MLSTCFYRCFLWFLKMPVTTRAYRNGNMLWLLLFLLDFAVWAAVAYKEGWGSRQEWTSALISELPLKVKISPAEFLRHSSLDEALLRLHDHLKKWALVWGTWKSKVFGNHCWRSCCSYKGVWEQVAVWAFSLTQVYVWRLLLSTLQPVFQIYSWSCYPSSKNNTFTTIIFFFSEELMQLYFIL